MVKTTSEDAVSHQLTTEAWRSVQRGDSKGDGEVETEDSGEVRSLWWLRSASLTSQLLPQYLTPDFFY